MVDRVMLKAEDVAREAGISLVVVYAHLRSGRLPGFRFGVRGRGTWRVARCDYVGWLQSMRHSDLTPLPSPPLPAVGSATPFSELNPDRLKRAWRD